MKTKQPVALVYELCPICGKRLEQGLILIHKRLGDLSDIDNQNIAFADHPCPECQKAMDMGAIMIVVADQSKTKGPKNEDLFRTGYVFGVTEDYIKRIFKPDIVGHLLKTRWLVMDYHDAIKLGFDVSEYKP